MLINPMGGGPKSDPRQVENIKNWATQALKLDEETTLMVTELHCTEPGCPPLETVIAVLAAGNEPYQYKIYKSIQEVSPQDISAVIEAGPLSNTKIIPDKPVQFLKKPSTGVK